MDGAERGKFRLTHDQLYTACSSVAHRAAALGWIWIALIRGIFLELFP
jgi:hypothetical protein